MAGFQNSVMVAKNMNFDELGTKPLLGIINAAGKLPIGTGNTAPTPEILGGSLTSPDSSITVGYSSPNITLTVTSPGAQSIAGDTGSISGTDLTIFANNAANNAGQSVSFVNSGTTSTFNLTDANKNTALGTGAGKTSQTYLNLTAVGYHAGNKLTSGNDNTLIGQNAAIALTTGGGNTAVGSATLTQLVSGIYNTCLGIGAGQGYTGAESSNICISNAGTVGDSHTIRIGTSGSGNGQQNTCYVAGITGVTAAGAPAAVSSTGQLSDLGFGTSTQMLTSNGAGVSPTWQAAPFVASPVHFQAYRTTNQTVAGGSTSDTIVFDTAISNVGSAYNTSTGIFTAPTTGFYAFSTSVFFNNLTTPSGLTQVQLAYTGSVQSLRLLYFGLVPATTGAALIATASWAMPMTANDTVKLQPFADGTGNYVIAGHALSSNAFTAGSIFSGWRIA